MVDPDAPPGLSSDDVRQAAEACRLRPPGGRHYRRDRTITHAANPVAQTDAFFESVRGEPDGQPLGGELPDQPLDFLLRARSMPRVGWPRISSLRLIVRQSEPLMFLAGRSGSK